MAAKPDVSWGLRMLPADTLVQMRSFEAPTGDDGDELSWFWRWLDVFDLEPRHLFGQAVLGRPSCMLCAAWQFVENLTVEETGAHFQFIHRVHATDRLGAEISWCVPCASLECLWGKTSDQFSSFRLTGHDFWWYGGGMLIFVVVLSCKRTVHAHFPLSLGFPTSASRWCCWCSDWQQIRGTLDARLKGRNAGQSAAADRLSRREMLPVRGILHPLLITAKSGEKVQDLDDLLLYLTSVFDNFVRWFDDSAHTGTNHLSEGPRKS